MTDLSPKIPPPRVEVCSKHGLRYNAAVEDGCARCRTEAGARAIAGIGTVARRPADLRRSLIVAGALVVGSGLGLFGAHWLAYRAGHAVFEKTLEEISEASPTEEGQDLPEALEEILGED